MKAIIYDPDKCAGCRLCEAVCSLKNTGEFRPSAARITVAGYDELFSLPVACYQCDPAYCLEACPAGAITQDRDTGVKKVDEDKCVGCKLCNLACPFGNIAYSSSEHISVKCELCDGEPECVLFCPTGALTFKELDTAMVGKKLKIAERIREVIEEGKEAV